MSIFNQDDNLKHCPITASVIRDIVNENKNNHPTCPITEQQLEERVSDILNYIYYSVKSGECQNSFIGFIWTFSLSMFGITEYSPEHSRVIDYLWNRLEGAGFVVKFEKTVIVISIPYEDLEWPDVRQVFAQTIASDLVPVAPISSPSPLMMTPSILRCDAIEIEDNGVADGGSYIN